jgi:hypothetical protein
VADCISRKLVVIPSISLCGGFPENKFPMMESFWRFLAKIHSKLHNNGVILNAPIQENKFRMKLVSLGGAFDFPLDI